MKHDRLRSLAHNFVHSFFSGHSSTIGYYGFLVSDLLAKEQFRASFLEADFLSGSVAGEASAESFKAAVLAACQAFPFYCWKNGTDPAAYRELRAVFSLNAGKPITKILVADCRGRVSADTYEGYNLSRRHYLDPMGRVRTNRKPDRPLA